MYKILLFLIPSVLLAPLSLPSQQAISFYESERHQKGEPPADAQKKIPANNGNKEYSIDIRFYRKPGIIRTDSLTCIFSTANKIIRFKFPTDLFSNLEPGKENHLVVSRKESYTSFFIGNYLLYSFADRDNVFDLRFPWFHIEFLSAPGKDDLLKMTSILIKPKSFDKPFLHSTAIKKDEPAAVRIFPNPVESSLQIRAGTLNVTKAVIYNNEGKELIKTVTGNKTGVITIAVDKLCAGIYLLGLFDSDKILCTQSFIKK